MAEMEEKLKNCGREFCPFVPDCDCDTCQFNKLDRPELKETQRGETVKKMFQRVWELSRERALQDVEALFADNITFGTFIKLKDNTASVEECRLIKKSDWQTLTGGDPNEAPKDS